MSMDEHNAAHGADTPRLGRARRARRHLPAHRLGGRRRGSSSSCWSSCWCAGRIVSYLSRTTRRRVRRRIRSPAATAASCLPSRACKPIRSDDLHDLHAAEDAVLNSYGWVDRQAGIVRIPIARAMELLAQRGIAAAAGDRWSSMKRMSCD